MFPPKNPWTISVLGEKIACMGFLNDLWSDTRGNVKYDLLKYVLGSLLGSSCLAIAIRAIQRVRHAAQQDALGYIILAVLIFCALLLVLVLSRSLGTAKENTTIGEVPAVIEEPIEVKTLPITPKGVDLHGSIDSIYFYKEPEFLKLIFTGYGVFVKVTVTNRGVDEPVITSWRLHIHVGDTDKIQCAASGLGDGFSIKRRDENSFIGVARFTYEPLEADFRSVSDRMPFRRGIPQTGWLRFQPLDYGSEPPHNATFYIQMDDSLGNTHWIKRPAQSYKPDGELIYVSTDSSGMLDGGIPLQIKPPTGL